MNEKRDLLIAALQKYDLAKPIPGKIQKKIDYVKKKILFGILKSDAQFGPATVSMVHITLFFRRFGIKIQKPATTYVFQTAFVTALLIMVVGITIVAPTIYEMFPEKTRPVVITKKPSGIVTFVAGSAYITQQDGTKSTLAVKDTIKANTIISTGKASSVTLQVKNVGVIRILPHSEMYFASIQQTLQKNLKNEKLTALSIVQGSIFSKIKKIGKNHYHVKTPNMVATVQGTEFLTTYYKNTSTVKINTGNITISPTMKPGIKKIISKGYKASIDHIARIRVQDLTGMEQLELKKLSTHPYVEEAGKKSKKEIQKLFEPHLKAEKSIDSSIKKTIKKIKAFKKLDPLDKLRTMGKMIFMFHMKDGTKLAGSIISQDPNNIRINTGEGTATIPKKNIIRRQQIK